MPRWTDLAVVVGLTAVAVLARRPALPFDGLVFDDAWVVVGASEARLGEIWSVGTNHPGFTALLWAWARVVSGRSELFALVPFVAGVAAPPAAYLSLRATSVRRGIALAGALLLVVAPNHVIFSGRVKPYVFETLAVIVLVPLVDRLAGRTWTWRLAAGWTLAMVVLGTGSAFLTVIAGTASLVLFLHPHGDRAVRAWALVAQGAVQVVLLGLAQRSFASAQVAREWELTYDGYFEWDGGPVGLVRQHVTHARRLGQELVAGGRAVGLLVVVAALVGLALAATQGRRDRVPARFLAALLGIALVGSWARQIPFGPSVSNPAFPGGRASLWLLPTLLFGLAWAVERVATWADRADRVGGRAVSVAAVAVSALVVASTIGDTPRYPLPGARTSWELIESELTDDTVVLVLPAGGMTLAAEPGVDVALGIDRRSAQGFAPSFSDPRLHLATVGGLAELVDGADRVIIQNGFPGFGDADVPVLEAQLAELGFAEVRDEMAGSARVSVWERSGP